MNVSASANGDGWWNADVIVHVDGPRRARRGAWRNDQERPESTRRSQKQPEATRSNQMQTDRSGRQGTSQRIRLALLRALAQMRLGGNDACGINASARPVPPERRPSGDTPRSPCCPWRTMNRPTTMDFVLADATHDANGPPRRPAL